MILPVSERPVDKPIRLEMTIRQFLTALLASFFILVLPIWIVESAQTEPINISQQVGTANVAGAYTTSQSSTKATAAKFLTIGGTVSIFSSAVLGVLLYFTIKYERETLTEL